MASQPDWLERELAGYRIRLLEQLEAQGARLEANTQAMRDLLAGMARASGPAGGTLTGPLTALSLPLDPEVLNRLLTVARFLGKTVAGVFSLSVTAKGDGTPAILATYPYPNTVNLFLEDLYWTTSYASPLVRVQAVIDGTVVTTPTDLGLASATGRIALGQFYYVQQSALFTVVNTSGTDATVSVQADGMVIDADFWRQFYVPLLTKDIEAMEGMVGL